MASQRRRSAWLCGSGEVSLESVQMQWEVYWTQWRKLSHPVTRSKSETATQNRSNVPARRATLCSACECRLSTCAEFLQLPECDIHLSEHESDAEHRIADVDSRGAQRSDPSRSASTSTQQDVLYTVDAYPEFLPHWNRPKLVDCGVDMLQQLIESSNRQKLLACRVAKLHMKNIEIREGKAQVDFSVSRLSSDLRKERRARTVAERTLWQECGFAPNGLSNRAEIRWYQYGLESENRAFREVNSQLTTEVRELRKALKAKEKAKDSSTMSETTSNNSLQEATIEVMPPHRGEPNPTTNDEESFLRIAEGAASPVAKIAKADSASAFQKKRVRRKTTKSPSALEGKWENSPPAASVLRCLTESVRKEHSQMLLRLDEKRKAEGSPNSSSPISGGKERMRLKKENPLAKMLRLKQEKETPQKRETDKTD
eukprot:Platyproteum_vivax@DN7000_c0_g1_i1.p1